MISWRTGSSSTSRITHLWHCRFGQAWFYVETIVKCRDGETSLLSLHSVHVIPYNRAFIQDIYLFFIVIWKIDVIMSCLSKRLCSTLNTSCISVHLVTVMNKSEWSYWCTCHSVLSPLLNVTGGGGGDQYNLKVTTLARSETFFLAHMVSQRYK